MNDLETLQLVEQEIENLASAEPQMLQGKQAFPHLNIANYNYKPQ